MEPAENGRYKVEWINTKNGDIVKAEEFYHTSKDYKTLLSPEYDTDIALIISTKWFTPKIYYFFKFFINYDCHF